MLSAPSQQPTVFFSIILGPSDSILKIVGFLEPDGSQLYDETKKDGSLILMVFQNCLYPGVAMLSFSNAL